MPIKASEARQPLRQQGPSGPRSYAMTGKSGVPPPPGQGNKIMARRASIWPMKYWSEATVRPEGERSEPEGLTVAERHKHGAGRPGTPVLL